MKKLFLIIGAPGSGKTTDAEIIAQKNEQITHYSTGNLLRDEVAKGSEIGKEIDGYVSNGNLVPIEIVIKTIMSAINDSKTSTIIIDGYPRSQEQMLTLDEQLNKQNSIELISVIEVVVSQDTAKDRVLGRARGADDNEDVFYNRMKVYTDPLGVIQDFYTKKNILIKIDGERSIEEIVKEMNDFIQTKI